MGVGMDKAYRQSILEILSNAEVALLEIVSLAATAGDYSGIDLARDTAEQVRGIRRRMSERGSESNSQKTQKVEKRSSRKRASSKTAAKKTNYPRFEIHESTLTKVGWSKKKNQEYAHRISRDVFEAVVATLAAAQRRIDGPISTEFVLELLSDSGQVLPSYQAYSVLAFLRSREVIRSSARGAYVIPSGVADRAHAEWLKREQRR